MEESLIFQGIKVEQKEKNSDLEKRIVKVIQEELKLNIQPEDIDKAHRVGPAEADKQNIIICFFYLLIFRFLEHKYSFSIKTYSYRPLHDHTKDSKVKKFLNPPKQLYIDIYQIT